MNNPHMYYWTKDSLDHEWRVLLVGDYESFEDGDAIVSELEVSEYWLMSDEKAYPEEKVPDEIRAFVESLLDNKDTYIDIQREYEKEGQHLL